MNEWEARIEQYIELSRSQFEYCVEFEPPHNFLFLRCKHCDYKCIRERTMLDHLGRNHLELLPKNFARYCLSKEKYRKLLDKL